ncbi:MAG: hypothetical protein NT154_07475, partial [Verrucomicrobia bacterium]|nr:hypothetical protein [Verrucomicrobiota bacterium]
MIQLAVCMVMMGSTCSPWFSVAVVISTLVGLACLGIVTSGRQSPTRIEYGSGFSLKGAINHYHGMMSRASTPIGRGARLNRRDMEDKALVAVEAAQY